MGRCNKGWFPPNPLGQINIAGHDLEVVRFARLQPVNSFLPHYCLPCFYQLRSINFDFAKIARDDTGSDAATLRIVDLPGKREAVQLRPHLLNIIRGIGRQRQVRVEVGGCA